MARSDQYLEQAESAAERANGFRKRARRAYRDLKFQFGVGWFLWACAGANVVSAGWSFLTQAWWMGGVSLVIGAAAATVRLKVHPRTMELIAARAKNADIDAELMTHAAENYMAAYDSSKWQEEFNALLPKPKSPYLERKKSQAQIDRDMYGDVYGHGVHAERELAARKARYQAALEMGQTVRVNEAGDRMIYDGIEYETVQGDDGAFYRVTASEAVQIRAQRARKRLTDVEARRERLKEESVMREAQVKIVNAYRAYRDRNEVVDLTDWQGDDDPRRVWADSVCDQCGEKMGTGKHSHPEYDRLDL